MRVNTVSPGPVATDLWLGDGRGRREGQGTPPALAPEEVAAAAAASMVTGRFSRRTRSLTWCYCWPAIVTGNVTGADIRIDGGLVPTW